MMASATLQLREWLHAFDFRSLLVEGLGWNRDHAEPLHVQVEGHGYALDRVAEKAGFVVYVCHSSADDTIPEYPVRRKIEQQVARLTFEHMIVFVDAGRTEQCWQWVKRERGKPAAYREHPFHAGQTGEPLLQRLQTLAFDLQEEAGLTVPVVASRVQQAMDVEKVTKRFYERFRTELKAFRGFIAGIVEQGDREWYASLMLNRMMFVYFIQKQGFLDNDVDYLSNRLSQLRSEGRGGRFQQFYRIFLLRLFHEGLGQPEADRAPDLEELLGKVPFLNGGLFDVHDLERDNPDISIPDEAFERVFGFFDSYQWHLDERPRRADNEINPDVLGYIFEKYINQKQMGAYYTKEDITGYISRSTVLPFLFDAARKECPIAFEPGGGVWRLLQDDPDRYIYPSVSHGVAWSYSPDREPEPLDAPLELPGEIAAGLDDVSRRGGWNEPAPSEYALPEETWRELVARRRHYAEVREKLAAGAISEINDLITLNLDLERFARDVIVQSEGPELLRAFWHALRDVSILDPTCGSGAFLFAALNILEPLYTSCLEGMQGFLDDLERSERPHHPETMRDFRAILEQVGKHPSERYFVLKSIVLNNLYGVDIMEEAVEICKLRLFLKLVAQLETYDQIEPLPDIDFNIRAGNTLIGFTSLEAVQRAMTILPSGQLRALSAEDRAVLERIEEDAEAVSRAFDRFREQQTVLGGEVTAADKANLRERLRTLGGELDRYLASEYGVDPDDAEAYATWRRSHQPFHWFVEFYRTMRKGGFDAVIGNPPYIEYRKVRGDYTVRGFSTEPCGNLYAFVWERSVEITGTGRVGLIIPVSAVCTDGFSSLRDLLTASGGLITSHFNDRPSRLFDGIEHSRLSIILLDRSVSDRLIVSSAYNKWSASERPFLFESLVLTDCSPFYETGPLPKFGNTLENSILKKFNMGSKIVRQSKAGEKLFPVYYTRKLSYFVQILNFIPRIYDSVGDLREPSELKTVWFTSEVERDSALGFWNSSLFYWLLTAFSDCRNLNKREIEMARLNLGDKQGLKTLASLTRDLMTDIRLHVKLQPMTYRKLGTLKIESTFPRKSKGIIDDLDSALADGFGFTEEELDFIVNYDVKYRMGRKG